MTRFMIALLCFWASSFAWAYEYNDLNPLPFYSWTPKSFNIQPSVIDDAVEDSNGDAYDLFDNYPQLKNELKRELASLLDKKWRRGIVPEDVYDMNSEYYPLAEQIFNDIRSIGTALYEPFYLSGIYDYPVNYGYCSAYDGDPTAEICQEPAYRGMYAIVMRIVSSDAFITGACDVVADGFGWALEWAALSDGNYAENKAWIYESMDKTSALFTYLENNGHWDVSPEFTSKVDDFGIGGRVTDSILRRYYDGGPQLISQLNNCLKRSKQRYMAGDQVVEVSQDAPAKINQVFEFSKFEVPYKGWDQSTVNPFPYSSFSNLARMYYYNEKLYPHLYRLARQMTAEYVPYPYDFNVYEDSPTGLLRMSDWQILIQTLTRLDPFYVYRIPTVEQVKKGIFLYPSYVSTKGVYGFGDGDTQAVCAWNNGEYVRTVIDPETGAVSADSIEMSHHNYCATNEVKIERVPSKFANSLN